ncbi:MAG: hypothetical protein ACLQPH_06470 [Acidimicrobiales bacterium]
MTGPVLPPTGPDATATGAATAVDEAVPVRVDRMLGHREPAPGAGDGPGEVEATAVEPRRSRGRRFAPYGVAGVLYLGLSVAFWWGAWSTHPTSTTTCGCGDASLYFWFLEWPAHAITHGQSILYSTMAFHPTGLNMLANTGVVAIGVVLAPVTWLFGPVASLNTASTLVPVLSALSMFWLLRRWVSWAPAAVVGGLLYGFSPVIFSGLVAGWLTTLLALPPLMVACLDELCVRRRRRPVLVGAALGGLVTLQFFISTEVLAVTGVAAAFGLVVLGLYGVAFRFDEVRRRVGRIAAGFGVTVGVAGVLLAYPVWFIFAGPAHFTGRVWPSVVPGYYGTDLAGFFRLSATAQSTLAQRRFGGYQGTALHQAEYLGVGLAAVLVVGTVVWWRDRRLWLFGAVVLATMAMCLTSLPKLNPFWVPWRVFGRVPVVQNILPIRFVSMSYLAAAVMLGIIVDHVRRTALAAGDRGGAAPHRGAHARRRAASGPRWRAVLATAVASAVAAVALVPIAAAYAGNVPLTMKPVVLPEWFQTVAPHLPQGQVVLTYPAAFGGIQAPMAWQAMDRMSFSLVGGGGPGSVPQRAGRERPGFTVLAGATLSVDPATGYLPATVEDVRRAVLGWGTTLVVIPDQPELPAYDRGNDTAYVVALMTAALGEAPRYVARAWTWPVGASPAGPLVVPPEAQRSCVGDADFPSGPPDTVPDCVLAASFTAQVGQGASASASGTP